VASLQGLEIFQVFLESAPWSVAGSGRTVRVLIDAHNDGKIPPARRRSGKVWEGTFLEYLAEAAFAIAQEWANETDGEVKLVVSGDTGEESVRYGVKTFRPIEDGRLRMKGMPSNDGAYPIRPTQFWPHACAFCGLSAEKEVVTSYGDFRFLVPECKSHFGKAVEAYGPNR
jgi:hypothetical protein